MQKHGRRLFPVIQTGAWQTYPMRTWAVGNNGMVDLECKKQVLLWACPTPTKSNRWCCLQTTGRVPTPHGSTVKIHCFFFLFFSCIFVSGLCYNAVSAFIINKPRHWSPTVTVYCTKFYTLMKFLSLDVKKKKKKTIINFQSFSYKLGYYVAVNIRPFMSRVLNNIYDLLNNLKLF